MDPKYACQMGTNQHCSLGIVDVTLNLNARH